jgi:hypothetical protein
MRRLFPLIVPLVLSSFFAGSAHAQTAKKIDTVIAGTVFGADGKVVPAASVTCQSSAGIRPRVVHTDAKGHYRITGLKQDAYDLRASANGAYSDWEKNIPLHAGQTKDVTLRLLNGNTAISGMLPAKKQN